MVARLCCHPRSTLLGSLPGTMRPTAAVEPTARALDNSGQYDVNDALTSSPSVIRLRTARIASRATAVLAEEPIQVRRAVLRVFSKIGDAGTLEISEEQRATVFGLPSPVLAVSQRIKRIELCALRRKHAADSVRLAGCLRGSDLRLELNDGIGSVVATPTVCTQGTDAASMDGTDCNRSGVFSCAIWPVEKIRCPVKIHVRAKTPGHCWSGETGWIVGIAVGGFEVSDVTAPLVSAPLAALLSQHPTASADVLELRHGLESLATAYAAERATDADLTRIAEAFQTLKTAAIAPKRTRIAEHDAAFHLAIADATHNLALAHVMHGLHELVRESMLTSHRLVDYDDDVEANLLAQHQAIFDAIIARDPQRARDAAGAHLDYVRTLYRARWPLPEASSRHATKNQNPETTQ